MVLVSPKFSLLGCGLLFILSTFILLAIRYEKPEKSDQEQKGFFTDFKLGFVYLWQHPELISIYIIQLLIMVMFMTAPVLLAPYAKEVLHANAIQFGHLEAALSIGVVIGGLVFPYFVQKLGFYKVFATAVIVMGLSFWLFSHNENIYWAQVLYFIIGLALSAWPLIVTRAQELTDLDYQGRLQGLVNSLSGVLILAIYLLAIVFGDKIDIAKVYWLEVLLSCITLALVWRLYSKSEKKADSALLNEQAK
ncbi:MFS transporter [Piscirickettsia litoralis]|uniref:MFS transporter n=1 Tax=Piscirickettsia litoralis TaxID=1891921 RepID=UPI000980C1BB|nr:MFS transporter [Piscirickettsia litoralis]